MPSSHYDQKLLVAFLIPITTERASGMEGSLSRIAKCLRRPTKKPEKTSMPIYTVCGGWVIIRRTKVDLRPELVPERIFVKCTYSLCVPNSWNRASFRGLASQSLQIYGFNNLQINRNTYRDEYRF